MQDDQASRRRKRDAQLRQDDEQFKAQIAEAAAGGKLEHGFVVIHGRTGEAEGRTTVRRGVVRERHTIKGGTTKVTFTAPPAVATACLREGRRPGRAPRMATNFRTRGSRRSYSRGGDSGDDGDGSSGDADGSAACGDDVRLRDLHHHVGAGRPRTTAGTGRAEA